MKAFYIFFAITLTPMVSAIDNGIPATKGMFPSVIKITNPKNGGHCTGTLLAPDIVLTAAHCVDKGNYEQQKVSYAGDTSGIVDFIFKKNLKVKKVFYLDDYQTIGTTIELMDEWFKSPIFKNKTFRERQAQRLKHSQLVSRKINLDIAFIELHSPQKISDDKLSRLSCEKLEPLSEVTMVGFGRNIQGPKSENTNTNAILHFGHNWFGSEEFYNFTPDTGTLVNFGDSGGPLLSKNDESKVYGVASTKTFNKTVENKKSTYAATYSSEAIELYLNILNDPDAPKALKDIVSQCL